VEAARKQRVFDMFQTLAETLKDGESE